MSQNKPLGFETIAIRTQSERTQNFEHSVPLYLTSSFVFEDAEEMRAVFAEEKQRDSYSRYSNPNVSEFAEKIRLLEKAEAGYAFATGMAAVFSTLAALLNSGDHILSSSSIFGSTHGLFKNYFPKWGVQTSYFDINKPESIDDLIRKNTKVLYVESPTNPGVDIIDLQFLGDLAKRHDLIFVVDNCFATPFIQTPIDFGADLVVHSATKLIDGQGRVLGGVVAGNKELINQIYLFSRNTGSSLSPFNAWVLSKSLETLALRVEKHSQNALIIAQFLAQHPNIEKVKYPFLPSHPQYEIAKKQMRLGGSVVAFEVKGGAEAGKKFLNSVELCSLTANLGDSRTIVTHPASTTHGKLSPEERKSVNITDGLVRISVGLETVEDIIEDLNQALLK